MVFVGAILEGGHKKITRGKTAGEGGRRRREIEEKRRGEKKGRK